MMMSIKHILIFRSQSFAHFPLRNKYTHDQHQVCLLFRRECSSESVLFYQLLCPLKFCQDTICPLATQGHQDSRQSSQSVALCTLTFSAVLSINREHFTCCGLIKAEKHVLQHYRVFLNKTLGEVS